MATFHVLQGPDKGRTLKTDDSVVLIGRASDQVPLTDQTVSRRHAQLKRENDAWTLYDLHSVNGTYLNGVRLQKPTRLKHGDQIRVGSTLFVYAGEERTEQFAGSTIPTDLVTLDAANDAIDASIVASVPSNEDSVVMAAPETASAVKAWRVIRELADVIGSLLPPDKLLARVMDIIFAEVEVERGVIFVRDDAAEELLPEVVRFRRTEGKHAAPDEAIIASRTIMKHVIDARDGVLCSNVIADKRFRSGKSVQNLGMRSVVCAPIVAREQVLGIIHLDCPVTRHTYTEHELRLITAIGYQTGLAIENARLVQAQLQQERLAATGETVAYLSHSIKNMLQGLQSGGDVLKRGLGKRDLAAVTQGWGIVTRNLDKVSRLMMNMLAFSKDREPHLELIQINKIVEEAIAELQGQADRKSVVLLSDLDEFAPIPLDYDGAHQLILNLVGNAIDAVPPDKGIVNVRTSFDAVDDVVVLTVADNGPGVPEEERERVFEPFHSTKGHAGTGLGLAVARKFVLEMGGRIELNCPKDGGAEFIVRLRSQRDQTLEAGDTHGPGA